MFKVRVIPCLDVKDGRVVKGRAIRRRDAGDPLAASPMIPLCQACFLDITASHENRGIILDVVGGGRGLLYTADVAARARGHCPC